MLYEFKHLAGRHDQRRHAPKSNDSESYTYEIDSVTDAIYLPNIYYAYFGYSNRQIMKESLETWAAHTKDKRLRLADALEILTAPYEGLPAGFPKVKSIQPRLTQDAERIVYAAATAGKRAELYANPVNRRIEMVLQLTDDLSVRLHDISQAGFSFKVDKFEIENNTKDKSALAVAHKSFLKGLESRAVLLDRSVLTISPEHTSLGNAVLPAGPMATYAELGYCLPLSDAELKEFSRKVSKAYYGLVRRDLTAIYRDEAKDILEKEILTTGVLSGIERDVTNLKSLPRIRDLADIKDYKGRQVISPFRIESTEEREVREYYLKGFVKILPSAATDSVKKHLPGRHDQKRHSGGRQSKEQTVQWMTELEKALGGHIIKSYSFDDSGDISRIVIDVGNHVLDINIYEDEDFALFTHKDNNAETFSTYDKRLLETFIAKFKDLHSHKRKLFIRRAKGIPTRLFEEYNLAVLSDKKGLNEKGRINIERLLNNYRALKFSTNPVTPDDFDYLVRQSFFKTFGSSATYVSLNDTIKNLSASHSPARGSDLKNLLNNADPALHRIPVFAFEIPAKASVDKHLPGRHNQQRHAGDTKKIDLVKSIAKQDKVDKLLRRLFENRTDVGISTWETYNNNLADIAVLGINIDKKTEFISDSVSASLEYRPFHNLVTLTITDNIAPEYDREIATTLIKNAKEIANLFGAAVVIAGDTSAVPTSLFKDWSVYTSVSKALVDQDDNQAIQDFFYDVGKITDETASSLNHKTDTGEISSIAAGVAQSLIDDDNPFASYARADSLKDSGMTVQDLVKKYPVWGSILRGQGRDMSGVLSIRTNPDKNREDKHLAGQHDQKRHAGSDNSAVQTYKEINADLVEKIKEAVVSSGYALVKFDQVATFPGNMTYSYLQLSDKEGQPSCIDITVMPNSTPGGKSVVQISLKAEDQPIGFHSQHYFRLVDSISSEAEAITKEMTDKIPGLSAASIGIKLINGSSSIRMPVRELADREFKMLDRSIEKLYGNLSTILKKAVEEKGLSQEDALLIMSNLQKVDSNSENMSLADLIDAGRSTDKTYSAVMHFLSEYRTNVIFEKVATAYNLKILDIPSEGVVKGQ